MPIFAQPIPPGKLAYALAVRGLQPQQIAFEAGISRATVSRAMTGGKVSVGTLLKISNVLARHPVKPELVALMKESAAPKLRVLEGEGA